MTGTTNIQQNTCLRILASHTTVEMPGYILAQSTVGPKRKRAIFHQNNIRALMPSLCDACVCLCIVNSIPMPFLATYSCSCWLYGKADRKSVVVCIMYANKNTPTQAHGRYTTRIHSLRSPHSPIRSHMKQNKNPLVCHFQVHGYYSGACSKRSNGLDIARGLRS